MRALFIVVAFAMALPASAQSIRGMVTNGRTAEAGVWVIAETEDLPTKFAKIVVTDERGRFLIPELPKATYRVWVRGYGLVDSKKVKASPGKAPLRLKASVAPNEGSAAQYYPSIYWYSMLGIPEKSEFRSARPRARWNGSTRSRATAASVATRSARRRRARCRRRSATSGRRRKPGRGASPRGRR